MPEPATSMPADRVPDLPRGTPAQRRRFYAAVVVFALWVGFLAVLAVTSGRRPAPRAVPAEGR